MKPVVYRPIDPFACAPDGVYRDDAVVVRRVPPAVQSAAPGEMARTEVFSVGREEGRLVLVHRLPAAAIDNDVGALIVRDLFEPGWVSGADTFERLLTGIVLSSASTPLAAWELFYRNTLRALDVVDDSHRSQGYTNGHGVLADVAPVYRYGLDRVREVKARSVLDLGSCFGFFPIRLARAGVKHVRASDISPGTCRLLEKVAARLRAPLSVLTCDAESVPLDAADVDVVTSLHLLEHVDQRHGDRILAEAVRVARRRVVVGVPMELVPDPAYGHVRTLTPQSLADAAARVAPGWSARVEEHHGAWLVLDSPR